MDNLSLTPEMLAKAKAATSAQELMTLAKAQGIELEAQEAKRFFAALREKTTDELNEEELDRVAGGSIERPAIPGSTKSGC